MPDVFVSQPQEEIKEKEKKKLKADQGWRLVPHSLQSFCYLPKNMRFETQGDSEKVILLLRKHGITNLPWIILSVFLTLMPLFLFPLLLQQNILPDSFTALVLGIILIWYLFTLSFVLVNFLLWYFTVSIVTDERIIDIDFINILHKEFSATSMEKVEDVTMNMRGFISAIFNFGDVHIQTAGTNAFFEFLAVPYPEKVVQIINNLMEQNK